MTKKSQKVASILAKKYEENPFVDGDVFVVPTTRKNERVATSGPLAVTTGDGEVVETAEIRRVKIVDNERFVKLFVANLDGFFDLKPGTMRLMGAIMTEMSQKQNINGDQIYLNYKRVVSYFEKFGTKAPAKGTFFSAMAEMTEKGFVAPSVDVNLWFINPAIFFNGDRVKFTTELRRKKTTSREKLEAMGQTSMSLDGGSADE